MIRLELLRTRVARRVLALFVVGALAPVLLLSAYAVSAVADQLRTQSRERLEQLGKSAGMSVMERLHGAVSDLRVAGRAGPGRGTTERLGRTLLTDGPTAPGAPGPGVVLSADQRARLASGDVLLLLDDDGGVWLAGKRDPADADSPWAWGEVAADYLWSGAEAHVALPGVGGFCVVAAAGRPLYCAEALSGGTTDAMLNAYAAAGPGSRRGVFAWSSPEGDFVGAHWELFLRPSFGAAPWAIVIAESEELVYAPLRRFVLLVPPVMLFGILLVGLMAHGLVRRTMEPLEALTRGTRRIAARDFDTRVSVDRDDEFGELADAFNAMAGRLGLQFRHLQASRAIDQAVLTASDRVQVVTALLGGFEAVVTYDRLAVLLLEREPEAGVVYAAGQGGHPTGRRVDVTADGLALLRAAGRHRRLGGGDPLPGELDAAVGGLRPALLLPLVVKGDMRGAVVAARREAFPDDDVERARQIVDQAAVALEQVQLLADLEAMSIGTLHALARAIDAKSRWTAGHSERVAATAVAIGRELGLRGEEVDRLERAALLHDVGKIGVPARVLDAPGALSDEEWQLMRDHVTIGARILEPVHGLADAVPVVLHHHERWDGGGYPHGLAGEAIPFYARIVAVADTFDAMASSRPYRPALDRGEVLDEIGSEAGRQFDPRVVAAFLRTAHGEAGAVPEASPTDVGSPAHG